MCPMGAMRPLSKVGIAAVLAAVVAWPSGVAAWGMDVHRLITRRAIDGLPAELKPFYAAKADFIAEHAVDPDLWRIPDLSSKFGPEEPNHFLDYDNYGEPAPFAGVPREWNAVVQKYGADLANKNGRVPWRAEEIFDKLVTTFVEIGRAHV